jgi:hypothetical protein
VTPIPLTAPDGTVYAYACGECRSVSAGSSYMSDRYTDEQVRELAKSSLYMAARCCACRKCGAYKGTRYDADRNDHCAGCWENGERARWEAHREKWQRLDAAQERAREGSLSRAKDLGAALALEQHMSDTSETCYCAGWLIDCEFALWQFCEDGPGQWGMDFVTTEDVQTMLGLSERCGGWWVWRDGDDETIAAGRYFVTLDEWAGIYAEGQP